MKAICHWALVNLKLVKVPWHFFWVRLSRLKFEPVIIRAVSPESLYASLKMLTLDLNCTRFVRSTAVWWEFPDFRLKAVLRTLVIASVVVAAGCEQPTSKIQPVDLTKLNEPAGLPYRNFSLTQTRNRPNRPNRPKAKRQLTNRQRIKTKCLMRSDKIFWTLISTPSMG